MWLLPLLLLADSTANIRVLRDDIRELQGLRSDIYVAELLGWK
jgi:hypothetical protein